VRRLWSPALAFGTVGLLGIFAATLGLQLHGGLVVEGLYALALQLVVSALALSAIDEFREPQLSEPGLGGRRRARGAAPSARGARLPRALWHFHLARPLPAGLLGCGLAMSLTLVAVGVLDAGPGVGVGSALGPALAQGTVSRSELALAALLALIVLLTLTQGGAGRYGWVVGYTMGAALGQIGVTPIPDVIGTIIAWGELAGAMMACTALVSLARGLIRRRRKAVAA
jgi:hypothetical protein